jgi:hypothetical protein
VATNVCQALYDGISWNDTLFTNVWSFTKAVRKAAEPSADDNAITGVGWHMVQFKGVYLDEYTDEYNAGDASARAVGPPHRYQFSVGVTGHAYLLEIEGLYTRGSRAGSAFDESVGGILEMSISD